MRLIFEFAARYLSVETGRLLPVEPEIVVDEPETIEELIRLPLGFQAPPIEGTEDDEEYEPPEADCG